MTDDPTVLAAPLIRRFEDDKLTAYPDPGTGAEPYTISIGLTELPNGTPVPPYLTITQAESDQWFNNRLTEYLAPRVDALVHWTGAQDFEIAALYSFAWNLGVEALAGSTMLRLYNAFGPGKRIVDEKGVASYTGAAGQFGLWVYAKGRVLPGLVNRRAIERGVFLGIEQS